MRFLKIIISLFLITSINFLTGQVDEQKTSNSDNKQIMIQNIELIIDSIGNGRIIISQEMSFQHWQVWREGIGKDILTLKRNIIKSYPKYSISDVEMVTDDENLSYTLIIKAIGVCKVNQNGKWVLDLAEKGETIQKASDRKYRLKRNLSGTNIGISQIYTIQLSKQAFNIELTTDAFDHPILRFDMKHPPNIAASIYFQVIGGILFLLGLVLFFNKRK